MNLKNQEPVHVKHEKCIFVPKDKYSLIYIKNLDFILQKDSQVFHIIIGHKRFQSMKISKIRGKSCVGSGTQQGIL